MHGRKVSRGWLTQDVYWHLGDARQVNQRHHPARLHPQRAW
jgi:hypothetical protein